MELLVVCVGITFALVVCIKVHVVGVLYSTRSEPARCRTFAGEIRRFSVRGYYCRHSGEETIRVIGTTDNPEVCW